MRSSALSFNICLALAGLTLFACQQTPQVCVDFIDAQVSCADALQTRFSQAEADSELNRCSEWYVEQDLQDQEEFQNYVDCLASLECSTQAQAAESFISQCGDLVSPL